MAGAVALLATSGCGGGTATTAGTTTQVSTIPTTTIGVPTHVFVMNSGRRRLVEPDAFTFNVDGAVIGKHLRWARWGKPTAIASGAFSEHRFSSSNRVRFRSNLTLTRPLVCRGAEYYTHASLPVPSSPTQPSVKRLPTPCG